jgi:NADH-quinone oxidoreductase subunit I
MAMIVQRPKLGWKEKIFFPEILRGLALTFRHMFRRSKTMQYPEQRWTLPGGYRGAPVLLTGLDGREKCVACQMCEFACPALAIKITAGEVGASKERAPKAFSIDFGRCIFCGYCQEACPEEAIWLKNEFELADYRRDTLIFDKETLLAMGRRGPFLQGKELPLTQIAPLTTQAGVAKDVLREEIRHTDPGAVTK